MGGTPKRNVEIEAQFSLAKAYMDEAGTKQDPLLANHYLRKVAVDSGATGTNAQVIFGKRLFNDKQKEAAGYLRRAANLSNAEHPMYAEALFYLGRCYEIGLGVEQDNASAVECYEKASEKKHAAAQYKLAFSYTHGLLGLAKKYQLALGYRQSAILQNHAIAAHDQALMHLFGLCGVKLDQEKAVELFRKAAKEIPRDNFYLGLCYQFGMGVELNNEKAAQYYYNAACARDLLSLLLLSRMEIYFPQPFGVCRSEELKGYGDFSTEMLSKMNTDVVYEYSGYLSDVLYFAAAYPVFTGTLAQLGAKPSCGIDELFLKKLMVPQLAVDAPFTAVTKPQSKAESRITISDELIDSLVTAKNGAAIFDIAGNLLIEDEKKNAEQALVCCRLAADLCQYAQAQYQMGRFYEYGFLGLKKDLFKACEYYKAAAKQRCLDALEAWRYFYINGLGGAQHDEKTAYELYKVIADLAKNKANSQAQYILAQCLQGGVGCAIDIKNAVKQYELAIGNNHTMAMSALGWIYLYGAYNVAADVKKAIELFRRGLSYGLSKYNLACCYEYNMGVAVDPATREVALELYTQSADEFCMYAICHIVWSVDAGFYKEGVDIAGDKLRIYRAELAKRDKPDLDDYRAYFDGLPEYVKGNIDAAIVHFSKGRTASAAAIFHAKLKKLPVMTAALPTAAVTKPFSEDGAANPVARLSAITVAAPTAAAGTSYSDLKDDKGDDSAEQDYERAICSLKSDPGNANALGLMSKAASARYAPAIQYLTKNRSVSAAAPVGGVAVHPAVVNMAVTLAATATGSASTGAGPVLDVVKPATAPPPANHLSL